MQSLPEHLQRIADRLPSFIRLMGPITGAEIGREFGVSDAVIRRVVNYLRRLGDPDRSCIGSKSFGDRRGYFWADTYDKIDETVRHLHSRASKEYAAASGLRKAFGKSTVMQGGLFD